jgi:antibiotic biosynthesis monooxygenase (ABM) superfamily enzyme
VPDRSVTVVVRRRVRPDRQRDFEVWAADVVRVAARFPGHQGAALLTPAHTEGPDNFLVFRFDTPEHLAAWDHSEEKREWLAKIADATIDVRVAHETGLEFWFSPPGVAASAPPPRLKMAAVTLLAIYPLVLAVQVLVVPHLGALPVVLRVLVIATVLVTLMTYAVMPFLVRVFRPWLFGRPTGSR